MIPSGRCSLEHADVSATSTTTADEQRAFHDRTASSIATMSSAFVSGTKQPADDHRGRQHRDRDQRHRVADRADPSGDVVTEDPDDQRPEHAPDDLEGVAAPRGRARRT